MTIQIGDRIPSVTLRHMTGEGPAEIATEALFGGKRVAVFGLPGAFTPTCSAKHLPGYVAAAGHEVEWRWLKGHAGDPGNERADELARQGVEEITGKAY